MRSEAEDFLRLIASRVAIPLPFKRVSVLLKIILQTAVVAGALTFSLVGAASAFVGSASTSGSAAANVIPPINIAAGDDLAFGAIVRPLSGSGFVRIKPDGTITKSGTLVLLNSLPRHPSSFLVTGSVGAQFTMDVPDSIDLIGPGLPMSVLLLPGLDPGIPGTIAGGGTTVKVGGFLSISALQSIGLYTGTFPVTVQYN